jgi:3-dehydroquinate dehydratase type I
MTMMARGLICVSVAAVDADSVLTAVAPVLPLADVVEIRLDAMRDPRVEHCIAVLDKPVLVTNRPVWEGGQWRGAEEERIELLCQGLEWGARYVDLELRAAPPLHDQVQKVARRHQAQVIVSSHDFQGTPESAQLRATLEQMMACGADIGKIVTTATSPVDVLRLLALQETALVQDFPLSAFAMGQAGTISRLATLYLGGCMTYAALSKEQATAPGQLTVHDLHTLCSLLEHQL